MPSPSGLSLLAQALIRHLMPLNRKANLGQKRKWKIVMNRNLVRHSLGLLLILAGAVAIGASIGAEALGLDSPGSGFGVKQYLLASTGLIGVVAGVVFSLSPACTAPVNPWWKSLCLLLICADILYGSLLMTYPRDLGPALTQVNALIYGKGELHDPLLQELLDYFEIRAQEKWALNQASFDLDRPASPNDAQELIDAIREANRGSDETASARRNRTVNNLEEEPIGEANGSQRYRVRFQNDLGLAVEGILSVPMADGAHPLIIIPNGMSSSPEQLFLTNAEDYHHGVACQFEGNYVVFALHLPSSPDFEYEVMMHDRMNWAAEVAGLDYQYYLKVDKVISALDYLETKSEVDKGRIAIYGLSMGGDAAIDAGVADERINVIAASGTNVLTPAFQRIFDGQRYLYPYYYQNDRLGRPDEGTKLLAVFPRKVIIELNRQDTTGNFDAAQSRAQQVKRIFALLGAKESAQIIVFDHAKSALAPNGHEMQITGVKKQIDAWFGIKSSSASQCSSATPPDGMPEGE